MFSRTCEGRLAPTIAASAGQLQLNVMEPVIAFSLFLSINAMENAVNSLRAHCVEGIRANAERTRDMVLNSLGIVKLHLMAEDARWQASPVVWVASGDAEQVSAVEAYLSRAGSSASIQRSRNARAAKSLMRCE